MNFWTSLHNQIRNAGRSDPRGELSVTELYAISAEVNQNLQRGFRWLYFSPCLEAVFERETSTVRTRYLIYAGLVAIVVHDLFLLSDYTMLPDIFTTALILRLGIITPLGILPICISASRGFAPVARECIGVFVTLLIVVANVYLVRLSQSPYAANYDKGFLLIIIFGNIIFRLRFWYAAAVSLAILAICALFFPIDAGAPLFLRIDYLMVLIACIVFTLFANYTLEQNDRRGYLLALRDRILHADLTAKNQRLADLSHLDPLTGIANRREFTEYLDHLAQASHHTLLAIVMLDIDHFKRFNDLYGHPAGDLCLRQIAAALSEAMRESSDLVARIGGEEFVVVLRGNDLESAAAVAERLRLVVQKLEIPHAGVPETGIVTLSAGIAAAAYRGAHEIQAILAAADAALYRAKAAGRNRVGR